MQNICTPLNAFIKPSHKLVGTQNITKTQYLIMNIRLGKDITIQLILLFNFYLMGQEILARYYKVGNHLSITIVALHSLLVYCTCQSISNFSHNVHAVCGSQYIVLRIYAGTINLVDIFLGWGTTHSTCILPYERSK